jgi:hypothetical protein
MMEGIIMTIHCYCILYWSGGTTVYTVPYTLYTGYTVVYPGTVHKSTSAPSNLPG